MKRVLNYVMKHKLSLIFGTLSMFLIMAADMVVPYIQQIFVDDVLTLQQYDILNGIIIAVLITAGIKFVFGFFKEYLFDYLAITVSRDVKKDLFNHIESLSFSYFDKTNTGELMSRVGEDADSVLEILSFGLRLLVEDGMYFIIAIILLFRISIPLTFVALATMPFIAVVTVKAESKLDGIYEKISDHIAELNTTAQENIAGVKLVKAFGREKHEILKFLRYNTKNYDLQMEQTSIWVKFFPVEEFLSNLSMVLVICVGGLLAIRGSITPGQLVGFTGYMWMVTWPMRDLGWLINLLSRGKASMGKIEKIMSIQPEVKEDENPVDLDIKGNISFKNVSFSYGENEILSNINLNIKAGSTVAVMGTTGAGKSTLVGLLGRNYDIKSGSIEVDGVDIKNLKLKSLRDSISIVPQDSFLFSDTVENNLRYGRLNASREEMDNVLEMACAKDFVDSLEEGYGTLIGERGVGLSGGQKQRLCIARALLRESKILILDDSTSALDMETEYELLKNLYKKDEKQTTFIIAHRISAVKNADVILYMENGRIVEKGNHEELLKKHGRYYEIYENQFKDFMELTKEDVVNF